MATYLARDIVDMVIDNDVKKKITSFYYDKMQESLALYADTDKQKAFNIICSELELFNKEKGHPFLNDLSISKLNNTSQFYEKYLTEKGTKKIYNNETSWINKNFYKLEWNEKARKKITDVVLPNDLSKIPFSIRNLEKEKSNFEEWLVNKKELAIDLPTNIFDKALIDVLQNILDNKNISYKPTDKYHYLLKLWLGENNLQPFYNYEREYIVYDEKVNFNLGEKPNIKDYFKTTLNLTLRKLRRERKEERRTNRRLPDIQKSQVLAVFNNAITKTEKAIRFTHETDRILLLMLKNTIESEEDLNIDLANIKTSLNKRIKISQKISAKLSFNPNKGGLIEKTITDKRKRKDFSMLKKYIHDRRLPELFEYFEDDKIEHSILKKELESYNRTKELIFDSIFEIEETLLNKAKDEIIKIHTNITNKPNIQHEPYLIYLKKKEIIAEDELTFLKVVRNTFSHNQFPPKETVEKFVTIIKDKPIAEQIYEIYDGKKRLLLERIKEL